MIKFEQSNTSELSRVVIPLRLLRGSVHEYILYETEVYILDFQSVPWS